MGVRWREKPQDAPARAPKPTLQQALRMSWSGIARPPERPGRPRKSGPGSGGPAWVLLLAGLLQELDETRVGVGGGRQVVGQERGVDFRDFVGAALVLDRVVQEQPRHEGDERQDGGDAIEQRQGLVGRKR